MDSGENQGEIIIFLITFTLTERNAGNCNERERERKEGGGDMENNNAFVRIYQLI